MRRLDRQEAALAYMQALDVAVVLHPTDTEEDRKRKRFDAEREQWTSDKKRWETALSTKERELVGKHRRLDELIAKMEKKACRTR
jgi:hypothetical protein